ncbi:MAG: Holliday junction resolvase RuvX [Dehalococcoidia bacterium]|nr:Holliday junction resolvase RuvX [Dehalococcoidia bacterium]MCA9831068.1 Holliday junction resolvase RuvX [Dehalococcoidia bacterium]MCB9484902.1 Holliday junction resolvase RuvX [Thermoflexaceae bacterium]
MPTERPLLPPLPRRLLALDLGERRSGVAVSDELGLFAHARPAIHARDSAQLIASVQSLVAAEGVGGVVVGVPLGLSGQDTGQTRRVRAVVALLRDCLAVPVILWDERLSTTEAVKYAPGRKRRESGELDSAAAAIVLQAVLDSNRAGDHL